MGSSYLDLAGLVPKLKKNHLPLQMAEHTSAATIRKEQTILFRDMLLLVNKLFDLIV